MSDDGIDAGQFGADRNGASTLSSAGSAICNELLAAQLVERETSPGHFLLLQCVGFRAPQRLADFVHIGDVEVDKIPKCRDVPPQHFVRD